MRTLLLITTAAAAVALTFACAVDLESTSAPEGAAPEVIPDTTSRPRLETVASRIEAVALVQPQPGDAGTMDAGIVSWCADGGTPPAFACPGLMARATPAELCASPRPNQDAEFLAIEASGAFVAPATLYAQIADDLAAIRQAIPATQGLRHMPSFVPGMLVSFSQDAGIDPETYTEWDCLNAYYGATKGGFWKGGGTPGAYVNYRPRIDSRQLEADYATLPGVTIAESNSLAGDSDDICIELQPDGRAYLFDEASGDCPAGCYEHIYYGARVLSDGGVDVLGQWNKQDGGSAPAWFIDLAACRSHL